MNLVALPNFFIVGAVKSGTTSIYAQLKKHPQVFLPEMKEPHFFTSRLPPPENKEENCIGNFDAYQRLYQGAAGFPAIGDVSASYLWDETSPERILEVCGQAKIIISLRDPIARAYSQYWMDILLGFRKLSFEEELRRDIANTDKGFWTARLYVELGLYHDQVRRYFDAFGRDRVLVVFFDTLTKAAQEFFTQITTHLGIDPIRRQEEDLAVAHNVFRLPRFPRAYRILSSPTVRELRHKLLPTGIQRWLQVNTVFYETKKPPMNPETRQFLQDIFEPDVCRLEDLLGRKLPELRKSWMSASGPL